MKDVDRNAVIESEFADFFDSELYDDEDNEFNKFYVIAKLHCGKENAKSAM